jgi:5'(3')-deoxyribonucleotidase
MKKTINLFVDMDGTIAKFYYKKNYLEKMYEQGYFANLPLYAIAKHIDDFAKKDTCVNVYILSACINSPYCEQEKTEWLLKNMPNINPKNFIFTKVGESKVQKIINNINIDNVNCLNILLDDYTLNLEQWESDDHKNMVGIKFLNGMNDTTKNWKGGKIKTFKQLEEIIQKLAMYGIY